MKAPSPLIENKTPAFRSPHIKVIDTFKASLCCPCVETELTATSWNFRLCRRVKKLCVDRQLIGYS